ncbi:MAG: selenocysteine-specific translation elongation factor [Candidatus Thorarchaeota archaeon]
MSRYLPMHIGLMGHIDHGKTELARALSEKVSTAGLDKHPQSKERGITIDLGFTMFKLHEYLVTLVDAPGHADLIRSVVAGANIIDAAILVVAADEGPKIQTGEHIIVLRSFSIDTIIVAVTKTALVDENQVAKVEKQMQSILNSSGISNYTIIRVSAKEGTGIDLLKETIYQRVRPKERDSHSAFLMPVDHSFPKKGHGTVVTGTILRGELHTDEMIHAVPLGKSARVRSIQVFGEQMPTARAGDRVGINLPDLKNTDLSRGDYLCAPNSVAVSDSAYCEIELNPLYGGKITKKLVLNATVGMPTITAEIIPFMERDDRSRVVLDEVSSSCFSAALLFKKKFGIEIGMRVLLMRTDLPPTAMRIIGSGKVVEIPANVRLLRKKIRRGNVMRIREDDVLVEGLASRKEIGERLLGDSLMAASGSHGKVVSTFGTRGVIAAKFDEPVTLKEEIVHERFVEEDFSFGH